MRGGEVYSVRHGGVISCEGWEVFRVKDPTDDLGRTIDPDTKKPIPQPRIHAHELMPGDRQPDFICWKVAGGVASEHDRLYHEVDYVRVWEQWAYILIEQTVSRSIPRA